MIRPIFYHQVVKNIIVAFGTIFDDVRYINDYGNIIRVPISYSPKEKFIEYYNAVPSMDAPAVEMTLPRFGFEITGLNYAPERFHNPLSRMERSSINQFMYARIPYDFQFNLYLATKKFEDSLKIVEQVVPYFTPELTLTVKDNLQFDLKTDIPVTLNSVGFNIEYEGSFETKRVIEWTLGFTVKGFMYSDVKDTTRIKDTITNLQQKDFDVKFSQLMMEVKPRDADRDDPHNIERRVNSDVQFWVETQPIDTPIVDDSIVIPPTI